MKKLHLCTVYENRPECCVHYPWNDANDLFEDCQFYDASTKSLRTLEDQRKLKSQAEIEQFCVECGKCCFYWENGKPIHACSKLKIVTLPNQNECPSSANP
jgi:hypothetical protein